MNQSAALLKKLSEVAPIESVALLDESNKSQWQVKFKPEATQRQKDDAQGIINSFVWDKAEQDNFLKSERNDAAKQNLALVALFFMEKKSNPTLTFSIYLDSLELLAKEI